MYITISCIGNVNVGKSTLFNLLTQSNDSLIVDIPGTTRDVIYGKIHYNKKNYVICDMPGINWQKDVLNNNILHQIDNSLVYVDIILFLIDYKLGITNIDLKINNYLKKKIKI